MPISPRLVSIFTNAAKALVSGAKDTGYTSNGIRKLDFAVKDDEGLPRVFTALQQNPNKISTPAKLQREGHEIVQIRDNDAGRLAGFVDLTENRFNSFEAIPQVVDYEEIVGSLGADAAKPGEVTVSATRTATPPVVGMPPTDKAA